MPADPKPAKRLKDPEALRRFRLAHIGELCWHCEARSGIHAHHRKFRSQLGDDHESNLVWLCGACHDQAHGIRSFW